MDIEKLYIDGSLQPGWDPRGWRIWRAVTRDGDVKSHFFGPNSLMACVLFVQSWNEQKIQEFANISELLRVAETYALHEGCV